MAVTIRYHDIALGAAESATVTSNGVKEFVNLSLLPFGAGENLISSFETGGWGLNGKFYGVDECAFWSEEISDENGDFETYPTITIELSERFSATGLTLVFPKNDYCKHVNITWYSDNVEKAEETETDLIQEENADILVCDKTVESFNKIVVEFLDTFLPLSSAKLNKIYIGKFRDFDISEFRSVKVSNQSDLISTKLPISQLTWTLDSNDIQYIFQFKQPVEVRTDDKLFCIYYIQESKRISRNVYEITCQDAIGILEKIPFSGAKYNNVSARELVKELVGDRFPLYISAVDKTISGVILQGNIREALRQVLFAWGVCAATDNSDGIRIFDAPINATAIPITRTLDKINVVKKSLATKVNVTAHEYTESQNGNIEINGVKYNDSTTVYSISNPLANAYTRENVINVTDAMMVSNDTAQETAQKVYNLYADSSDINVSILWEKEKLGDYIMVSNAWGGVEAGNIAKLEMTFSNTLIAKLTINKSRIKQESFYSGELYAGEADA